MKVVAFLQNCWFPPDTPRVIINRYLTDEKYRRIVLSRSMSGKRLVRAFGPYYNEIWWDNASVNVADRPQGRFPHNITHMSSVIQAVRPLAIVCLGSVALQGIREINNTLEGQATYAYNGERCVPYHYCPHPNARGITQAQLNEFAKIIIDKYLCSQE